MSKMIEMKANEDNSITVAELISKLQKIKDKNAKIILLDSTCSGRASGKMTFTVTRRITAYIPAMAF